MVAQRPMIGRLLSLISTSYNLEAWNIGGILPLLGTMLREIILIVRDYCFCCKNANFRMQWFVTSKMTVNTDCQVQRKVAKALDAEYHEQPDGDHFFSPPFPQLIDAINENVSKLCK